MTKKKTKTQKVRFRKGDRRPGKVDFDLSYSTEMIKRGKKILWQVIESPTGSILQEFFFEEDAQKLSDFQNKNKVFQVNGGVPSFLCVKYNPNKAY